MLEGLWPESKEVVDQTLTVSFSHILFFQKIFQVGLWQCLRRGPSCAGVGLSPALGQVSLSL